MAEASPRRVKDPPNSVPRNTEEGRAMLQARLARFAKVATLLFGALLPLGIFARRFLALSPADSLDRGSAAFWSAPSLPTLLHAAFLTLLAVVWAVTRRGKLSTPTLDLIDAVMSTLVASAIAFGGWNVPPWARAELVSLFAISLFLAIRAALIPSTVMRSVLVGGMAATPGVVMTYLYYARHPRPSPIPPPGAFAVSVACLSAAMVAMTAVITRAVHGLRERAREAMQLGQYTLDEKLGEGGMGVVYKAHHALLRRPTAIKLLPPEKAREHDLVRFEREVQLTSMLTHPNTVAIYDFGRTPEGTFYYVMEYLDGIDLQLLVAEDGPQLPARVVHFLSQVCASLAEAHEVGLIHRDIKPANVIVCERTRQPDLVKLLDFGLVRKVDGPADPLSRSNLQHVVGTPFYLSPEAIVAPESIDARSDLYSVGALGYELLTGRPPFEGATVFEVCGHHLHSTPVPPSDRIGARVDPGLEELVLACLAKTPDKRPSDAGVLRQSLLQCACAAEWSDERARHWWSERGARIRSMQSSARRGSSLVKTLAVALQPTVRAADQAGSAFTADARQTS
jgi:serine/threonine-protein kinase